MTCWQWDIGLSFNWCPRISWNILSILWPFLRLAVSIIVVFWTCVSGVLFILIFSWYDYTPATYGSYKYPTWGDAIGWILTLLVIAGVVVTMIVMICVTEGSIGEVDWTSILFYHSSERIDVLCDITRSYSSFRESLRMNKFLFSEIVQADTSNQILGSRPAQTSSSYSPFVSVWSWSSWIRKGKHGRWLRFKSGKGR